jgi:glycosyltransferase involved in cell wall biosynthesis
MLISVIIPCYNVEDYIEECVESVYTQTYKDFEVICIDNNSTDSTWNKLIELKEKYPSITLDVEKVEGAPAARNKGLSLCKGEWVQFLDADDLLLPIKLQHQIDLIELNKGIVFIAGGNIKRSIDNTECASEPIPNIWQGLFFTQLGNTCANLWNYEALQAVSGWDSTKKSSQEYNLMFRLLKKNDESEVLVDPKQFTIIRERESGQISTTNIGDNLIRYLTEREDTKEWLKLNKSNIFISNQSTFTQHFAKYCHFLAKFNFNEAIKIHNRNIPSGFKLKREKGISNIYILLYNLLGFSVAERVKGLFNYIISKG